MTHPCVYAPFRSLTAIAFVLSTAGGSIGCAGDTGEPEDQRADEGEGPTPEPGTQGEEQVATADEPEQAASPEELGLSLAAQALPSAITFDLTTHQSGGL